MKGSLEILSVGEGDTKLSFDKNNPAERARAAKVVEDMLKRGYALLVQAGTDPKDGAPLYRRALAFDPDTCEYVIAGMPDDTIDIGRQREAEFIPAAKKRGRKPGKVTTRIPAENTRAVAVARTAGG